MINRYYVITLLVDIILFGSYSAFADEVIKLADFPNIKITNVTDQDHVSYIVNHFQSQFSRSGDKKITACEHITEYVENKLSGHDYSYGANCTILDGSHKLNVFLCDDNMIGKFTLKESGSNTTKYIAHFIHDNCPPGG